MEEWSEQASPIVGLAPAQDLDHDAAALLSRFALVQAEPAAIKSARLPRHCSLCRPARPANGLLLLNLCDREPGGHCNRNQDGMLRVARQAQSVRPLPRADAHVRGILDRTLLVE